MPESTLSSPAIVPIYINKVFVPPPVAVVADGRRCGIMQSRIVCPLSGAVSPAIKIHVVHNETQNYAAVIKTEVESFEIPAVEKPKASHRTIKHHVLQAYGETIIMDHYKVDVVQGEVEHIPHPTDGVVDITGRPLCPYCCKFSHVKCWFDSSPRIKKYPEPYCKKCMGRLSLLPRRKVFENIMASEVASWDRAVIRTWMTHWQDYRVESTNLPDEEKTDLIELGVLRLGQLSAAAVDFPHLLVGCVDEKRAREIVAQVQSGKIHPIVRK